MPGATAAIATLPSIIEEQAEAHPAIASTPTASRTSCTITGFSQHTPRIANQSSFTGQTPSRFPSAQQTKWKHHSSDTDADNGAR
jgi:hypothetical protein